MPSKLIVKDLPRRIVDWTDKILSDVSITWTRASSSFSSNKQLTKRDWGKLTKFTLHNNKYKQD